MMAYLHFESGDRVQRKDGKGEIKSVAFTGNAGWVYFYGGGCVHSSELKLVKDEPKDR